MLYQKSKIQQAICQMHMAGQMSKGVDPSWGEAFAFFQIQNYVTNPIRIQNWSLTKRII